MNLEHLNNLESYPAFNKQANLLTDGAKAIGRGVLRLFGKGSKATPPPAPAAGATGAAAGQAAATADDAVVAALKEELRLARRGLEAALRARDGARQQARNYKSEAAANRNWARVGKGTTALGGAGTIFAGGMYLGHGTTPPDHSLGGLNQGNSKGNNNDGNTKGQGEAELDWIDEAAAKISEFYEKHPGVAWGGTGLAALGGLYGLYNVLEDEDEDEDY